MHSFNSDDKICWKPCTQSMQEQRKEQGEGQCAMSTGITALTKGLGHGNRGALGAGDCTRGFRNERKDVT